MLVRSLEEIKRTGPDNDAESAFLIYSELPEPKHPFDDWYLNRCKTHNEDEEVHHPREAWHEMQDRM